MLCRDFAHVWRFLNRAQPLPLKMALPLAQIALILPAGPVVGFQAPTQPANPPYSRRRNGRGEAERRRGPWPTSFVSFF